MLDVRFISLLILATAICGCASQTTRLCSTFLGSEWQLAAPPNNEPELISKTGVTIPGDVAWFSNQSGELLICQYDPLPDRQCNFVSYRFTPVAAVWQVSLGRVQVCN